MRLARLVLACCGLLLAGGIAAHAQSGGAKRAITFDDLIAMHRISDPQISPDGKWIAYSVGTPDMEANRQIRNIWVVNLNGGEPRQLTSGGRDVRPRWSPDGSKLAFLSDRGSGPQVNLLAISGGEPAPITKISSGADNELWSPDGQSIAFVSNVYPDCPDQACNEKRAAEAEKNKVKAHVADHLLYRHWTAWSDGTRSHLFIIAADGSGAARDLTPGADYDVPPFNLGGPEAIAFSPDSKEICFTANTDKVEATSTNGDLFTVPTSGVSAPVRITTNLGNDWGPAYSPDGKWIAYRSQATAGYESERWRLMLYERASGKHTQIAESLDVNPEGYAWSPDSQTIYFPAQERIAMPIFAVAAKPGSTPRKIIADGFNAEFSLSADGKTLAFTRTSLTMPAEIFVAGADGSGARQLTHHNAERLAQLNLNPPETFTFTGAAGARVEGLLFRPPNFDASKKYPMLLLVHGGPQGAWEDAWGYRWNQQMMAAPGYVVVAINPHGSTGYGQAFTAEISGDWGGEVFGDLMKGVDYAIAKYPFIDGARLAAAGGSYGGYMIDWMESAAKGRFKCLISHAGPYDAVAMNATEELWFQNWEFKGMPWDHPELYAKWSPSAHAGEFGKYKTPTLVIGGELDFRIPYTQELEFFTALQLQGVPSKLVIFPDEGHWILKPDNSQFWYQQFLGWLATYLK